MKISIYFKKNTTEFVATMFSRSLRKARSFSYRIELENLFYFSLIAFSVTDKIYQIRKMLLRRFEHVLIVL